MVASRTPSTAPANGIENKGDMNVIYSSLYLALLWEWPFLSLSILILNAPNRVTAGGISDWG
jgi:hypothetical protein